MEKLLQPRLNDGIRQAVRILTTARGTMSGDRTRSDNALNALVRNNYLGVDARKALTASHTSEISRWRPREEELSLSVARAAAIRLAKLILVLDEQLISNEKQLEELVKVSEAAPLLEEKGFREISGAKCLTAWSHQGRVRNEAAFASLAGVNPIPASSGNTVRHRLNRGGDRALNSPLHMVAVTMMTPDPESRKYVEKRRAEGRTARYDKLAISSHTALASPINTEDTETSHAPRFSSQRSDDFGDTPLAQKERLLGPGMRSQQPPLTAGNDW